MLSHGKYYLAKTYRALRKTNTFGSGEVHIAYSFRQRDSYEPTCFTGIYYSLLADVRKFYYYYYFFIEFMTFKKYINISAIYIYCNRKIKQKNMSQDSGKCKAILLRA